MLGFSKFRKPKMGRLMVGIPKNFTRFGIRDKVHTMLSTSASTYKGHHAFGGVHLRTLDWCTRYAHSATYPLHCGQKEEGDVYFDMRRPYEFLMSNGTDADEDDAKVGIDYFFPSYTMVEKLRNAIIMDTAAVADENTHVAMRTNSASHTFTFTNFGRHRVLIIFEHLMGNATEEWNYSSGQPDLNAGTDVYTNLHSIENWVEQKNNLECIVIPACHENDQQGVPSQHTITANFNDLWGTEYKDSIPDIDNDDGVWWTVNKSWVSSAIVQQQSGGGNEFPLLVPAIDPFENGTYTEWDYQLKLHALLLDPHGKVVTADKGATAPDAGRASLDTNAFNIDVVSSWDVTVDVSGHPHKPRHYGRWARAGGNATQP